MPSRKLSVFALATSLILSLAFALPAGASPRADSPQTYTVLVGWENPHQGIDINSYFPRSLSIHVGDTVHWVLNANEIHTVTFPSNALPPPILPSALVPGANPSFSPVVFVPAAITPVVPAGGQFNGSGFVNSGIMGHDPGQIPDFSLTFTAVGTSKYACIIHGTMMSGEIKVVNDEQPVPSPNQAASEGRREIAAALAQVPAVQREASTQIVPPVDNANGTTSFTVRLGYSKDVNVDGSQVSIDLMQFFPDKLVVRPGDHVTFMLSPKTDAPHTVTFLNGEPEPPLAVFHLGFLYVNPLVVFPSPLPPTPLTRTGIFNSGLLVPGTPNTSFSFTIGDMSPGIQPFLCQIHDTSGMQGKLIVVPKSGK